MDKNKEPTDIDPQENTENLVNEIFNEEAVCECDSVKKEDISEIETLKSELEANKSLLLRTAAEYENFRKRTEKEKTLIYSNATASTILAILPIADSLERALEAINDSTDVEYQKGLNLIYNQFNNSLKNLKVECFGKKGESFNPDIHNAVSHIENEELDKNIVSEVFQKGYKISDKVIRYATVQTAN